MDTAVLDERPTLRRPATARALSELVAQERAKQDARLASLRRLRGEAAALFDDDAPAGDRDAAPGIVARLFGRAKRRAPSEAELRERYEHAQVRARRAVVFAESLAALEAELGDEVRRLGDVLTDLAHDEGAIEGLRARVRALAVDVESALAATTNGEGRRALEATLDAARARANALEAERDALRGAEDRLLGLVEGEKMLATRLAHLRVDVERAAKEAARRLDEVADALRALVTASDAKQVVRELEAALERLTGSLDESARVAKSASDALAGER